MPTTIPIDLTVKNLQMYLGTVIAVVREELGQAPDLENARDPLAATLIVMALEGKTVEDMTAYPIDVRYMNRVGQSKKCGFRSERALSATSTITSSSGRVNGWGRPNASPHPRRIAPPAITSTRSVRVVRSDRLSAGDSLTDQNPAANSSFWATRGRGQARPAFPATPLESVRHPAAL